MRGYRILRETSCIKTSPDNIAALTQGAHIENQLALLELALDRAVSSCLVSAVASVGILCTMSTRRLQQRHAACTSPSRVVCRNRDVGKCEPCYTGVIVMLDGMPVIPTASNVF